MATYIIMYFAMVTLFIGRAHYDRYEDKLVAGVDRFIQKYFVQEIK